MIFETAQQNWKLINHKLILSEVYRYPSPRTDELSQLRCKTASGVEKFRKYFLSASLTGNTFSIVTSCRSY